MDFDFLPYFTRSPFTLKSELDQMQGTFTFGQLKLESRVIAFDLRDRERLGASDSQSLHDLGTRLDDAK